MEKKLNTFKNCCIEFDNNSNGIYHAGETVSGTANITIKGTEKYKGIILRVKGWSNVRWTESRTYGAGKRRVRRTISYTGQEVYFKTYNDLIQPQENDDLAVEYTSGVHKFTFTFSLPSNLPCSFEGTYGFVRYEIKATVKRPYKSDSCYRAVFTVISSVNLNTLPAARVPHSITKSKNFYFLFSKKGTLSLNVDIPTSGCVRGEAIQIKCILNNQSKIKMEQLKVSLVQEIMYTSNSPYHKVKSERRNILSEFGGKLDKMEETTKIVSIVIPFLPLSSQYQCSIISIRYFIKVKTIMEGVHGNIRCEFPITIGSIPFTDQSNGQLNVELSTIGFNTSQLQPTTSNAAYNSTPGRMLEPPSYEEAMMSGPSQSFQNLDINVDSKSDHKLNDSGYNSRL